MMPSSVSWWGVGTGPLGRRGPGVAVAIRRFGMVLKLRIEDLKLRIEDLKLQIDVLKLQIDVVKLRIEDLKLPIESLKLQIDDLKLRIDDVKPRTGILKLQTDDFRPGIPNITHYIAMRYVNQARVGDGSRTLPAPTPATQAATDAPFRHRFVQPVHRFTSVLVGERGRGAPPLHPRAGSGPAL